MNTRITLLLLLIITLFSSCVSKKQLTYFQGTPEEIENIQKVSNEDYKIQINDILHITLKSDNEELTSFFNKQQTQGNNNNINADQLYFTGYSVDKHGNIRIPYLDNVNVLGYSTDQIREKIQEGLSKYFKDTNTIFIDVKLAGIRVTITGEVGSPGTKNILQDQVSIVEAIANSGDITELGDRSKVQIIRKTIDKVEKIELNLTNVDVFTSKNYYIKPNDIIYVPPLPQKSWGTGTTGFQTFTTVVSILSFFSTTYLLIKSL
ncbi:polysaccharide biosynthesis/export family protein [Aureivirga sp. CE67]|uniref:polysaccharide biosynthesis/export family protein n=1 Tax=Aureivirga sp. CE67 TaxID=1788983 RepID=UPI0018CB9C92|nr:polysaccharide biosynthesis/export family protein [Aureivirga sp. CE67]